MTEYTLSQINPPNREEFLRSGAIDAAWVAHGYQDSIEALRNVMEEQVELAPEKMTARLQFLGIAVKFLETERDKQLDRALAHLSLWKSFRQGELSEETAIPG